MRYIIATLAIASCKKSSLASTSSKLVGTWKFHQMIKDGNGNNTIDAADTTVTVDTLNLTVVFNANGTLTQYQAGVAQGSSSKWSVNGNYIVTVDSGATTGNGLLDRFRPQHYNNCSRHI